jgi:hypothetical protein
VPQSKSPRIPASRIHQAYAAKTMQSDMISPDRLLEFPRDQTSLFLLLIGFLALQIIRSVWCCARVWKKASTDIAAGPYDVLTAKLLRSEFDTIFRHCVSSTQR